MTTLADDQSVLTTLKNTGAIIEHDDSKNDHPVTSITCFLRQITPEGLQALAELESLPEIIFIGSGDTELTPTMLKPLQRKRSLKRMSISFAKIPLDSAKIIGTLKSLEALNLKNQVELGPQGFEEVFNLAELQEITLAGRLVDDEVVVDLVKLRNLKRLTLESVFVTDKGILLLKRLDSLKSLRLHIGPDVTSAGVLSLSELDLTNLEITFLDADNDKLKDLRKLSGLKSLHMRNAAKVSDDGIPYLTELRELKELDLNDAMLTMKGIKELRSSLPTCKVVHDARTRN
jgi:hypothetical protein